MKTKIGRVPVIVDTRETGPKLIAVTFINTAKGAKLNSAKNSSRKVCQFLNALNKTRKDPGLHKNTKTNPIPKFLTEYTNHTGSSSRAYLPDNIARAVNKLAPSSIGKALFTRTICPPCDPQTDIVKAPATTIKMAIHWRIIKVSPRNKTANTATKTGKVCIIAEALDASSNLYPQNIMAKAPPQQIPEITLAMKLKRLMVSGIPVITKAIVPYEINEITTPM
tara:strand:- start:325 stop:993 length:669 start_codon:yes stop_codon:yes gene_type:complete